MSRWLFTIGLCVGLAFGSLLQITAAKAQDPLLPRTEDDAVPQLLETVGLLAGVQLYQTYLNIGLLADGRAEGTYEDEDVKQILGSVLLPLEKIDRQLDKVSKLASAQEDREALAKLRSVLALLRQQGKDLETFWASGKEADGKKYETTRKKVWGEISVLLELDRESNTSEQAPSPRSSGDKR